MSIILMLLKWFFILLVLLLVAVFLFLKFAPTFGTKANPATNPRILNSANYDSEQGRFVNLIPTQDSVGEAGMHELQGMNGIEPESGDNQGFFKNFLFPPAGKNPSADNPIITEPLDFNHKDGNPLQDGELVWLGHSTVLFRTAGKTLITDPVFHRASPLPIGGKQFAMTNAPTAADLPFVDAVLISHDHYDHLDHLAIAEMKDNVGHFYVPLGVKSHLMRWGVSADKISEYDWYEETMLADSDIQLAFTPARHFSGRSLTDRNASLWGSWVVKSPELSLYFSGDGGYSPEFAKIGKKYGGFDIAFIEDGAYNLNWADIHMLPEQSAQAGIDVGAKVVLPIHWGKFDLSTHQWTDPINRIKSAMDRHNANLPKTEQVQITTPKIGQVFDLNNVPVQPWWE